MKTTTKLGDLVRGTYHSVPYIGIVSGWGFNGSISVTLLETITVYRVARESLYLADFQQDEDMVRVSRAVPAITESDLGEIHCEAFVRKEYLDARIAEHADLAWADRNAAAYCDAE